VTTEKETKFYEMKAAPTLLYGNETCIKERKAEITASG
jgi:hypothetical protein